MLQLETFNIYILLCVIAPIIGAFLLTFIFIFEKQIDSLEEEKRSLELKQDLQRANILQLNQQIQPHFFFNALNSLLSLARINRKEDLVAGIEALATFFKFKYNNHEVLITLKNEIQFMDSYLNIQQLRFGHRLTIHKDMDDEALSVQIPPFILQTIIENAYKHSFEKHIGPAELSITIKKMDKILLIEIKNTQPLEKIETAIEQLEDELQQGYGLENIRQRLELIYGLENVLFSIQNNEQFYTVTIHVPA
ncbi:MULTISPECIES: histidine kinase [Lysinibacillus]|uniref:Sensor histidine kinase n=1 Tax=Lysinibacillus fusiformis TaxID=28031 RepID=A0A2I0V270_9BACI|nr:MULTISPECIES: histidine kinase [Lysinibacillus]KUF29426.1 histidine kinase [Lysinibacillus sp. F5]MEE3805359.1 histidine kinase [Lysinibacillus fusiformis]PKU52405.1 sensor histidine kinase [Lysinibacillus fusiformis]SCZ02225.1 GHKL domain-containing protein [Lysinibacillus sp. SG9]SDB28168.1 GHKL domain-containing protein [Lysinibacillus sp. TC-37]